MAVFLWHLTGGFGCFFHADFYRDCHRQRGLCRWRGSRLPGAPCDSFVSFSIDRSFFCCAYDSILVYSNGVVLTLRTCHNGVVVMFFYECLMGVMFGTTDFRIVFPTKCRGRAKRAVFSNDLSGFDWRLIRNGDTNPTRTNAFFRFDDAKGPAALVSLPHTVAQFVPYQKPYRCTVPSWLRTRNLIGEGGET